MRRFALAACTLLLTSCSDHEPLVPGGTGRGRPADIVGGGLKWDARADVRFTGDAFEITNRDDHDWWHVTLVVHAGKMPRYSLAVRRMDAGHTYTVPCSLFKDREGRAFDPGREAPAFLDVECSYDEDGIPGGLLAAWPANRGERTAKSR